MLAQYVFTSANAPFRIVRHGHRWRALFGDREAGRYDTPEDAIRDLRAAFPEAKLPRRLSDWRYLPEAALLHLPPPSAAVVARLAAA
ncbi:MULTISPECIES: hypothetical protein [unclassified Luteibacter]|uniref:hypothetical protein n=1 Tax=unclassified Luteibacter TaxID=2620188 RepID=UPI0008ADBF75|nr:MULTISPECIES: hypothetical protein [unclassified Luteibacter]SEO62890.1 hypothetical protein SAMN02800692_1486 [Luteibacter sp. UNC138MFCol5.1]SEV85199.1 hypothetical protein SAMN04515660_0281 [Luteibacter sp. 329MFSha]